MPQDQQVVDDNINAYLTWVGAPRADAAGAAEANNQFRLALSIYIDDLKRNGLAVLFTHFPRSVSKHDTGDRVTVKSHDQVRPRPGAIL